MANDFVYDLISEMRGNPRRRESVAQLARRIDSLSHEVSVGKSNRKHLEHAQAELVEACGFNFGMLIPTMFPAYPEEKPLDLASRPFMYAMTCMAPNSVVTFKAGRQVGKCVTGETLLRTEEGSVSIRDLFDAAAPL